MAKHGMPMGGGMNMNMMKQMQKLQQDMLRTQEELEARTYETASGGGAVKAVVSGKRELVSIEIKPEAVDPDDVEMLQDLILAAVNEGLRTAEETMSREMQRFTGGLGLGF
ncbi:MAG: YbaB/EbfC family nucleoid-associated protein [Oscillospiraceae bacterium]|jgi:DNA-binding YbaB/EbfC family protein|nr:YbaB/EbfC family nucleoid-associated protein [Oscillospiraceae bacterium]